MCITWEWSIHTEMTPANISDLISKLLKDIDKLIISPPWQRAEEVENYFDCMSTITDAPYQLYIFLKKFFAFP